MSALVLADLAPRINAEHAAAVEHGGKAITHALNVGELLLQAKLACKHGEWLPWLREHVSFSDRTAQGYMRLAQRRDIRSTVADMSVRQALEYVATPRKSAFEDDLKAWMASAPPKKPVDEWTLEDAQANFAHLRGFDEVMHRHGVCDGTGETAQLCTVCDLPDDEDDSNPQLTADIEIPLEHGSVTFGGLAGEDAPRFVVQESRQHPGFWHLLDFKDASYNGRPIRADGVRHVLGSHPVAALCSWVLSADTGPIVAEPA